MEFDPGPPPAIVSILDDAPDYAPFREHFWFDWGPVYYRGRWDGTARLLCVASDPGPTERVAARTLVGDAGQRVQGFLTKLGLTRSYICVNAFIYALFPSHSGHASAILHDQDQVDWRNRLYDAAKGPDVVAVVAFGENAQTAVSLWPGKAALPVVEIPHPSSRDEQHLLDEWRAAVTQLRGIVSPDADGDPTGPNYGASFDESDYAGIPPGDLPFGVPTWFGDDAWGRSAQPSHHNSVSRPNPDDHHTLVWIAPNTDPIQDPVPPAPVAPAPAPNI